MGRARHARRIAVRAAYGGGTIGLTGAALAGLLAGQAKLARRTVGMPTESAPHADGVYGANTCGDGTAPPLRLVVLGDSSAAGLGVQVGTQTPGAVLAAALAAATGQPVDLTTVAEVGAQTSDLAGQVTDLLPRQPDVAVILIGANDVTHRVRPSLSVRRLDAAVRALREAGTHVVVGTCPDLGTIQPIAQPLRYLARRWSRSLAAAQTIGVVEAGGRSVSLGDLLGPEFVAEPGRLFSPDRFHPSASGYARVAEVLLPSVLDALGHRPDSAAEPVRPFARGEGVDSLPQAAARASEEPGAEVSGTQVEGHDRGPRGRWVVLRHRLRNVMAPGPAHPPVRRTGEDLGSMADPTHR